MAAFGAKNPRDGGPEGAGDSSQRGGKAQSGEAGTGEVEEVRHGEGVVAYVAMGEEVADVGDVREVAGAPEAVGEGDGCGEADEVKVAWATVIQRRARFVFGVGALRAGEGGGEEYQEREVGGEGVVLLVGGEREEAKHQDGEEGEKEGGALREM